ncbi:response regulator transcription factor [Pedobacter hartonius]|uniref:Sigma-B regulation protein RsbU (Phosphoserine phosphatase)/two-component system, OmpR family, alkaline phosphatase synthesis response regulator PhoP n=1 Tax=Pedobacter hartonius TaxID=425514 RepID=A0A1H4D378_9SPHI|nr:response regulator [Pedobacter hartonius]SEA66899.1 sigma-B regulation protein RsbU (phosphoserine phosphatase)/two-component system, OmpR family, alkaline phosphatase synthesis response regulator PhoP [Pedobacter hartonius]
MSKKILAVDDDNDILDVIRIILEDEGYEVFTLANGKQVFDFVGETDPDLILLDVMLGGLDGRDICRALKEHEVFKKIPVVMISASHNLNNLLLMPGAPDNFLAKPFDIDRLVDMVKAQLAA